MAKQWLLLALIGALILPLASQARARAVPADFVDELVTSVTAPTDLNWTPDGRMLITQQSGQLRVVQNGSLLPTPALSLDNRVCSDFERGLLGVEVDPNFATNHYIYLYYTFNKFNDTPTNCTHKTGSAPADTPVNRVSRFVLGDNNSVDSASEQVLVDGMPSPNGNHNAGDLLFGKDGKLYITIGDGGRDYATGDDYSGSAGANDAARDKHVLTGKVLRINPDGSVPSDNPFLGAGTTACADDGFGNPGNHCQETWAWGLRNPFRITLDPNSPTTRIFINDVGQNIREEIDAGVAGSDYGWNCREGTLTNNTQGPCSPTPPNMVDPIFEYEHGSGSGAPFINCNSITGGAFVPNGVWPSQYNGVYLFSDYVCGKMFVLEQSGPTWSATEFATGLGGAVSLDFGPFGATQALYYTTYSNGGQIRRIRYTGSGNQPPTASFTAQPSSGAAPLNVSFDASASSDPESGALQYIWSFGDGTAPVSTTTSTINHTYSSDGTFQATLVVRDPAGLDSSPATQNITVQPAGNTPPDVTITSPAPSTRFAVGQMVTFSASATDQEDGPLGAANLTLVVVLHHDTHTHPFLTVPMTDSFQFAAPAPEDLLAASNSYLELQASATDSNNTTTMVTQTLLPNAVDLTFDTQPAGLQLQVEAAAVTSPTTLTAWQGQQLTINAPLQANVDGWWRWQRWSDDQSAQHTIMAPAADDAYTATFVKADILVFLPTVQR